MPREVDTSFLTSSTNHGVLHVVAVAGPSAATVMAGSLTAVLGAGVAEAVAIVGSGCGSFSFGCCGRPTSVCCIAVVGASARTGKAAAAIGICVGTL